MSKRILTSLAIMLVTLSAPHMVSVAHAQTSFGKDRIITPTNRAEWSEVVSKELMQSIQHTSSSLAMHGRAAGLSSTIVFEIARDGTVTNSQIIESNRNAAQNQALIRAMSRAKKVTPFTSDMAANGVSLTFELGTKRN